MSFTAVSLRSKLRKAKSKVVTLVRGDHPQAALLWTSTKLCCLRTYSQYTTQTKPSYIILVTAL